MASDLSTYLGNKVLRWLGGNAMPTAPTALYMALFNGDPKGAGTEVTTTINASGRMTIGLSVPASGTTNTMSSNADVDFGNAAGAATVSYCAVYDAASSGNLLASKQLTGGPFSIAAGTQVIFNSGDITFTIGS